MDEQILHLVRTKLPRVSGELERLMRNSIRIGTQPVDEAKLPIGTSKIGGSPDLPPEVEWPKWKAMPLAFIAQICLPAIADCDLEELLPNTGILYFFYDAEQNAWGYDPQHKGSLRVLYYAGDPARLVRTSPPDPLPEWAVYSPCALEFSTEVTLPPIDSIDIEELNLTSDPARWSATPIAGTGSHVWKEVPRTERPDPTNKEEEDYGEIMDALDELRGDTVHRMLGYPDPIQGDMQLECQLVSHGIYCGDPTGYRSPEAAQLREGATDWLLLLQVDSDDNAGMMWGDAGRIYYWMRRQDLERRNFSEAWMILQCY